MYMYPVSAAAPDTKAPLYETPYAMREKSDEGYPAYVMKESEGYPEFS